MVISTEARDVQPRLRLHTQTLPFIGYVFLNKPLYLPQTYILIYKIKTNLISYLLPTTVGRNTWDKALYKYVIL